MKNSKRKSIYLLLIVLLLVTIGFALLSRQLKINGISNISSSKWDIHWDNVNNEKGIIPETPAYIKDTEKKIVEYEIMFNEPGEFYEFTVDAINEGTMDGKLKEIVSTVNGENISTLPNYITYSVTNLDGSPITPGEVISKKVNDTPGRKTYKVRIKYEEDLVTKEALEQMDEYGMEFVFDLTILYIQDGVADDGEYDPETIPEPVSLASDSWATIQKVAQSERTSENPCGAYSLGDTKTVNLGSLGKHDVRLVNCTKPEVCDDDGFSQTACGFVFEFTDSVMIGQMHNVNGSTVGGYPAMQLYNQYLKNNSTNWIANYFPKGLRDVLIDTYEVSGHGTDETENHSSTDKLYLLTYREIWGWTYDTVSGSSTDYESTRWLDFYEKVYLDNNNSQNAVWNAAKKGSNNGAWLRSPSKNNRYDFINISNGGNCGDNGSTLNQKRSVVPAFRIG